MAATRDTLYTPANSALSPNGVPLMCDATCILSAIAQGDPHAAEQFLPLVYHEAARASFFSVPAVDFRAVSELVGKETVR